MGQRLHRQQHALHVRIVNDELLMALRIPALASLVRVMACELQRALGHARGVQRDAEPHVIHHREHAREPRAFSPDQPGARTFGVAHRQHASRAAPNSHLVLQRHRLHVVADRRAILEVDDLGHEEQRQPLHARRGIRRASQHEMHDVLRQVVLAPRNVDLAAEQPPRLAVALGASARGRKIGSRLRLGHAHRCSPLAARQARKIAIPKLL
jgi:hypothetical protein